MQQSRRGIESSRAASELQAGLQQPCMIQRKMTSLPDFTVPRNRNPTRPEEDRWRHRSLDTMDPGPIGIRGLRKLKTLIDCRVFGLIRPNSSYPRGSSLISGGIAWSTLQLAGSNWFSTFGCAEVAADQQLEIRNHGGQGSHTLNLLRRERRRVAGRWQIRNWELETHALEKRMTSSTAVEEQHTPQLLDFPWMQRFRLYIRQQKLWSWLPWSNCSRDGMEAVCWALTWGAATSVLLSQIPIAASPHLTGLQNTSLAKHVANMSLPEEGFS